MIRITVNGEPRRIDARPTVADLVEERTGIRVAPDGGLAGAALGIAVAVNAAVVPRGGWSATVLADGDAVEIVSATQGG
ncbi:sulfur carrier protein ThiS [Microbacterium sp. X-17]|uniref:sulfur carrier protein ThiS n=1 Tax=Microbacterium sp. X-17 TaxID=3144404 RepID=UPI0031F5AA81